MLTLHEIKSIDGKRLHDKLRRQSAFRAAVERAAKEYQRPSGGIEVPMPAMLTCGVKT